MDDKKLIGIDALAGTLVTEFPGINVEMIPSYNDMLFLFRIGAANWELWAGSYAFHHLIDLYGSEADKGRLEALNVGYINKSRTPSSRNPTTPGPATGPKESWRS